MEDKQMLELILNEIREMKSTQELLVQKVDSIESTLETHTQKIDGITEQLGKVSELEPVVQKLVKDVSRIDSDLIIVKKFITS